MSHSEVNIVPLLLTGTRFDLLTLRTCENYYQPSHLAFVFFRINKRSQSLFFSIKRYISFAFHWFCLSNIIFFWFEMRDKTNLIKVDTQTKYCFTGGLTILLNRFLIQYLILKESELHSVFPFFKSMIHYIQMVLTLENITNRWLYYYLL